MIGSGGSGPTATSVATSSASALSGTSRPGNALDSFVSPSASSVGADAASVAATLWLGNETELSFAFGTNGARVSPARGTTSARRFSDSELSVSSSDPEPRKGSVSSIALGAISAVLSSRAS
jgi:hypothetical protein